MITIAIPTYNRGEILVETLRRLDATTTITTEIIVVDQTLAYPEEIERELRERHESGSIRWIRLPTPSIPHAMNRALLEASNRIVLFVDDDVAPPAGLDAAHETAYELPGVWAVVGQVLQPGESPQHFDEQTLRRGDIRDIEFRFNHDTRTSVQNAIACNLSVDRDRALSIGGFDENFFAAAYRFETDFALRLVRAGGTLLFEPAAALHHLKIATGGVRAHGDHRRSASPAHPAGDYYFARIHVSSFWKYAIRRMRRNVATRWHLRHPWAIPPKIVGEVRGLLIALQLAREGQRLCCHPAGDGEFTTKSPACDD